MIRKILLTLVALACIASANAEPYDEEAQPGVPVHKPLPPMKKIPNVGNSHSTKTSHTKTKATHTSSAKHSKTQHSSKKHSNKKHSGKKHKH